jgi:hypothetical protein
MSGWRRVAPMVMVAALVTLGGIGVEGGRWATDSRLLAQEAPPPVPPAEPTPPAPRPRAAEAEGVRDAIAGSTMVWIGVGMVALGLLALATLLSIRGRGRTVLKE